MTQQTTPVSKAQPSSLPKRSWLPVIVGLGGIVEAALSFLLVYSVLSNTYLPGLVGLPLYSILNQKLYIDWDNVAEYGGLAYLTIVFVFSSVVTVYAVYVYRLKKANGGLPVKQKRILYRLLVVQLLVPICFIVSTFVYAWYLSPLTPITHGSPGVNVP